MRNQISQCVQIVELSAVGSMSRRPRMSIGGRSERNRRVTTVRDVTGVTTVATRTRFYYWRRHTVPSLAYHSTVPVSVVITRRTNDPVYQWGSRLSHFVSIKKPSVAYSPLQRIYLHRFVARSILGLASGRQMYLSVAS